MKKKKYFDNYPSWCCSRTDLNYNINKKGKLDKNNKTTYEKIKENCAEFIRETNDLGAAKLFLLWFLKNHTVHPDGKQYLTQKEAAQIVDTLANDLRGDTSSVFDDGVQPDKKQITSCEKKYKEDMKRIENMNDEEFEKAIENNDAAAQYVLGIAYFYKIKFKEDIGIEGDNGYDFKQLSWDKELWNEAQSHLRSAAEQGLVYAQRGLAACYRDIAIELDRVINQNEFYYDHAFFWNEIAIDKGMNYIFVCCAQALYWLRRAAAGGDDYANKFLKAYYEEDGFSLEHGFVSFVSKKEI